MLFLSFVARGQAWASVVIIAVVVGVTTAEDYYFTYTGVVTLTMEALKPSIINMPSIPTPVSIPTNGNAFSLQADILDPVMPGILTLGVIMLVYRYLMKGGTMMKATMIILAAGVIMGCPGLIGAGGLVFGPEGLVH